MSVFDVNSMKRVSLDYILREKTFQSLQKMEIVVTFRSRLILLYYRGKKDSK